MDDLKKRLVERIERDAEKHALGVEWKGEDYGARKQYYADCYKACGSSLASLIADLAGALERYQHMTLDERPGSRTRYSHAAEALFKLEQFLKEPQ